MPTEKQRITISCDDELIKMIDDFRFENRYPSQSASVIALVLKGFEKLEDEKNQ